MMKCPQCGYERKEADNIINADECPKCGIIYHKWKAAPVVEAAASVPAEKSAAKTSASIIASADPSTDSGEQKITKIITAAVLTVLVIVGGHYLFNALLNGKPSPEKSKINDVAPANFPSSANINQPYPETSINPGEVKQQFAAEKSIMQKESMSAADLFRKYSRSVVVVKTQTGMGSGFFINYNGHIVTNKHVLTDWSKAEIKTVGGNIYKISGIIREDAVGDLVIASTDAPSSESAPVNLTAELPKVGEKIMVIGNPLGLEQTLADGIVSSIRTNQSGVRYIQVTAPVSSGNSGGPLLNMYGEVIGVATFQYKQGQNLNFCVAAERIVSMQSYAGQISSIAVSQQRSLYCYADAQGELHFVDWRTGVQILRPDGSLDRKKFEEYALDSVGGNPLSIDPAREAGNALEENKERMFKAAFPDKSFTDPNLLPHEQNWWEKRQRYFYNEAYNNAVSRKYRAAAKYNYMMRQFDFYSSRYSPLQ